MKNLATTLRILVKKLHFYHDMARLQVADWGYSV